jgi:hypothetical protein
MRRLIHTVAFFVFAAAFTVGLMAVVVNLVAGDHESIIGVCAIVAVAAYAVGWFTEPEGAP